MKTDQKAAHGDFQTPPALARAVCRLVQQFIQAPASIVEPTCGVGGLLVAAADAFPGATHVRGYELSADYTAQSQRIIAQRPDATRFAIAEQDYFAADWRTLRAEWPSPLLLIGNPPWVTNAQLSALGSDNLPVKANTAQLKGLDALTGKSNFDISEWMLRDMIGWLPGRQATLAMLVKTAVARKVLRHAWAEKYPLTRAVIYEIDAKQHFSAAVDACLLLVQCDPNAAPAPATCPVFASLTAAEPRAVLAYTDGLLLADARPYHAWKHLQGESDGYQWRSGLKHDCAAVMELDTPTGPVAAELEPVFVYPLLKSSDIAAGSMLPRRWMIVPQRTVGEDTSRLRRQAPRTWAYLEANCALLDARKSIIYRNRPRFSIFGIGDYAFAPWKVAISGLYKRLAFTVVGPHEGRPVMVDDTVYFLPCQSEAEATFITELLTSDAATSFLGAFIFWDSKRPITVDVLRRLDLRRLAQTMGRSEEFERLCTRLAPLAPTAQLALFA